MASREIYETYVDNITKIEPIKNMKGYFKVTADFKCGANVAKQATKVFHRSLVEQMTENGSYGYDINKL